VFGIGVFHIVNLTFGCASNLQLANRRIGEKPSPSLMGGDGFDGVGPCVDVIGDRMENCDNTLNELQDICEHCGGTGKLETSAEYEFPGTPEIDCPYCTPETKKGD